jgi:proteasome accessory factor C
MSRPLRLSADEALAIVVALRTLADVPGLQEREAVERALAKVESAAGGLAEAADAVAVRVERSDRNLAQIRRALDAGRALHLSYYVAARDERTERDVDPVQLHSVEGRWYLQAWCRLAEGMRLFRLDRIDALRALPEPSRPPASAVPRDLSEGVYQPAPEHPLVTLRLTPAAGWVADYYPCESVRPLPDGGLVATLRVADPSWVRRLVLGFGAAATVLDPRWLADQVHAEARAALAGYASG